MSRITVIGGTGYAGSAIVAEAAARGHQVTALSRSLPDAPIPNVTYVQGDATDEAALSAAIEGADIVVGALAPARPAGRTPSATSTAPSRGWPPPQDAPLFVVGGYSSLRPRPGRRSLRHRPQPLPAELHGEIRAGAALIIEDLPAAPATLDWVFVSPALKFGAHMPGERLGRYRLGDDVAVQPEDGGAISAADYALGLVDLIEKGDHHRHRSTSDTNPSYSRQAPAPATSIPSPAETSQG